MSAIHRLELAAGVLLAAFIVFAWRLRCVRRGISQIGPTLGVDGPEACDCAEGSTESRGSVTRPP